MRKTSLKGVIIGAGFFARFQADGWKRIGGVDLAAVADPLPGRAEDFATKYGIPRWYTDASAMLEAEKPDFADIVTRPDTHRELTELAAGHAPAVICQKPMAPSLEECEAMVRHCGERGVRLLIHENWRWQPWYREAQRLIADGALGRVFHLGFRMRTGDGRGREPYQVQPYFRRMERLLVYETAVHFLDTFRFLGGDLQSVFCQTNRINPVICGEDYALIQVSFRSGAKGLIDANRISGSSPPEVAFGELRIEGERRDHPNRGRRKPVFQEYGKPEALRQAACVGPGYKGDSVKALQEHLAECLLIRGSLRNRKARHISKR